MTYQKPTLQRFGHFRDLTRLGFSSASDGFSIIGIGTSPGCETSVNWNNRTYTWEIGCPVDGPSTS